MGAPLAPVPQTLKVFLEGFVDGDDVYKWGNVLHFTYAGAAPSNANCATIATDISGQWGTHMAPECPSPLSLQTVRVTDLTSDSAGDGSFVGDVSGSRGDDSIPANAAVLISYPASTRYKGGHPRSYLLAGGNADLEGAAHWSTLFRAEVQTHWQAFLSAIVGLTVGSTTISAFGFVRYHGKFLPNSGPPHFYLDVPFFTGILVSNAIAAAEMASQRRRIGRRKS